MSCPFMPTHPKALALALAAMVWGMINPATHAALIASDDFESYGLGGLNGNNGGSGWTGGWNAAAQVTVVSGGLSYNQGSVSINGGSRAAQFIPNEADSGINDGIISRALASSQTGTVYMSFLFSDTVNANLSNDFIQVGFDSGTLNPRASVMRRNGTFQARSNTTTSNSADSSISTVVGDTFLLVLRAERSGATYDNISLFVNPTSNIEPGSPDASSAFNSALGSLDDFVARSAFHDNSDTFLIDEITIGTTFADVVPVPEPSTAVLGLMGLLPLLRRRR